MIPAKKHLIRALLLCCAFMAVVSVPTASAAPKASAPCWKRLLNDWYDGTINNIYPLPCYREAISHLPPDVEAYSSAKDDILAAQLAAANHQHAPKESSTPGTDSGDHRDDRDDDLGRTTTTGAATETAATTTTATPTTTTPDVNPAKKKHGVAGVLADLTPGDPQAFPLPLLVLGALAILLVIAGAAGMIYQRSHPRDSDAE